MSEEKTDSVGVKLHQTMDATIWAEEFIKMFPGFELDTMRAWFSNSIMCGWDHAHWELEPKLEKAHSVIRFYAQENEYWVRLTRDPISIIEAGEVQKDGSVKAREYLKEIEGE